MDFLKKSPVECSTTEELPEEIPGETEHLIEYMKKCINVFFWCWILRAFQYYYSRAICGRISEGIPIGISAKTPANH